MDKQKMVEKIYQKMLDKGIVMIEISARHVHLSQEDLEKLFGKGYQLTPIRELSQKGQYLCKERVDIIGPKSTFKNVAILGPCRNLTQIEVAASEARKLGIAAPIRLSGHTHNTPGTSLSANGNTIEVPHGVIIAKRHIHVPPQDAYRLNLTQGEVVSVKVLSDDRALTFEDTIIRIDESATLAMHIDVDEANAAEVVKLGYGLIQKIN
ncbi:MAG: phosphate propanoyltransferase [Brevinemataceae bacterium]